MNKKVLISASAIVLIVFAALISAGFASAPPSVSTLDSISDKYQPVRFDHAKHTSLAGNCGTCHHQHGNSASLPCKECHAVNTELFKKSVTSNFVACKNCHGTYDPANPRMPGLKTAYHQQCFQCHRGMAEVGESPAGCTAMCHGKRTPEQKG